MFESNLVQVTPQKVKELLAQLNSTKSNVIIVVTHDFEVMSVKKDGGHMMVICQCQTLERAFYFLMGLNTTIN